MKEKGSERGRSGAREGQKRGAAYEEQRRRFKKEEKAEKGRMTRRCFRDWPFQGDATISG